LAARITLRDPDIGRPDHVALLPGFLGRDLCIVDDVASARDFGVDARVPELR
jgi:hypothetical protein